MPRFADEVGKQPLAQSLFDAYKHKIRCPTCPGTVGAQGYNLDSAGKSATDGLPRRYFACQRSNSRGSTEGCRRASCAKYIELARGQLKPDDFFDVVRRVRSRFEQGSEYYQALGTYLQSGLPSTTPPARPSTFSVYSPTSPPYPSTSPTYPSTSPPTSPSTSPCRQPSTDRGGVFSRFARPTIDTAESIDTFKRPTKRKADAYVEASPIGSVVDKEQRGRLAEHGITDIESLVARLVERSLVQILDRIRASEDGVSEDSINRDDNAKRSTRSTHPQTPCPKAEATPAVLPSPVDLLSRPIGLSSNPVDLPSQTLIRTPLQTPFETPFKTPSTSSDDRIRSLATAFLSATRADKKSIRAEAKSSGLYHAFKAELRETG